MSIFPSGHPIKNEAEGTVASMKIKKTFDMHGSSS